MNNDISIKARKALVKVLEIRGIEVLDDNANGCIIFNDDGELVIADVVIKEMNFPDDDDGTLSIEEFDKCLNEFFSNPHVDFNFIKFARIRHDILELRIFGEDTKALVKHVIDVPFK